jgi:hypothetical protein
MNKDFADIVSQLTKLRTERSVLNKKIYREKQSIIRGGYAPQPNNDNLRRSLGSEQTNSALEDIRKQVEELDQIERDLTQQLNVSYNTLNTLVEELDDQVPILFFPVRLETAFSDENTSQLWIRIFPDDIAVNTHEEELTQSEIDEGKAYWRKRVDAIDNVEVVHAWDLLCHSFGAERAAWVALQMTPTNPTPPGSGDPLTFPSHTPKPFSWGKQPVTDIMPDAFVIYAYANDGTTITFQTNNIPDEVKMGIDPTLDPDLEAMSFDQQVENGRSNELVANTEVEWMINFDAAIAQGLGAKLNLTPTQYDRGFKKILVLGVKSSLTSGESKSRLERLIDSHHYTDGFSLLKQGTSTNNTDTEYSGYSAVDFGNPTTYKTEQQNPLFAPVYIQQQKRDGQFLCEALGIDYNVLQHIFQADGQDISNAMYTTNVLYQVAFGYTANELMPVLGTRRSNNTALKRFFSDYVRSRGALPSVRSGIQPYGILPASVYSRINWESEPNTELYARIQGFTSSLDAHWASAVASIEGSEGESRLEGISPAQQLSDVLALHAVSTDYVQRIGLGAGYIWNNLEYAALQHPTLRDKWSLEQSINMDRVLGDLALPGLNNTHKAAQINYLENQSSIGIPLVAGPEVPLDGPLPGIEGELNMLQILHQASFDQLRDEDFASFGLSNEAVTDKLMPSILYRLTRQSLMLEYYEAACELLGIEDEVRGEVEFVNIVDPLSKPAGDVGVMGELTYGKSRYHVMTTPFQGYSSIANFLSSEPLDNYPEAGNLVEAKASLLAISTTTVRELNLLTAEVVDSVSFRLDSWRLALVNQRLNTLRGITEGSPNRNLGIYLGAYGWLTNVRKSSYTPTTLPSPVNSQFSTGILRDEKNKGYIHAPSINQAVTGAVMLSGYQNRALSTMEDPMSINLSSERIRVALDILDGVRNGQQLAALLG